MVVILEGQSKIAPWQEENGVYGLMVSIKLTIIISINYNMIFLIALWISIANIYLSVYFISDFIFVLVSLCKKLNSIIPVYCENC